MKNQLVEVQERINPYIHRTPVLTSKLLNEIAGCELFFKCENFQRMGAFKMRGAVNAIMQLTDEQKQKGVVTHSSGNFAQALALAAKSLGIAAYVVMPSTAPTVKKNAVKGYGGIVVECAPTNEAREAYSNRLVAEKGLTFIHPSNDLNVILGQGTAAMELLEDYPDISCIYTPVGGGGLVAGTILAAENFSKKVKVVGAEPALVDDAYRSLVSNKIETHDNKPTIADGLKTQLGDVNFPIIKKGIDHIVLVEEDEIIEAMRLIWERMKIVIEPSSAVAFAGLLKEKGTLKNQKVGIILSGGNVDVQKLPF
ncbi:threonine ammonia-lyase [Pontibacter virosus]|uniref:Threonine dehydratase n=1 Tax=Pontibacter virosus TaxID=1765052 RepID=A0A2U1AXN2_9BACT|nr:threonine/serine dehydratase [Pontibacter virosus]PVY41189.1 threonine dehydratase [Pontibacter virosus]